MKAFLTLLIVLLFGATALAQNIENNVDVETFKMDLVLDSSTTTIVPGIEITKSEQDQVARLYKFKNSRVKKALTFTTKRNKAKMA
ncbi:hypothetical protein [Kriegella aquimaris]|uniref:Uncharacterized protein n=1 Tax=Kriegella aquimaris TaxID=192904 RepID=A0A1G9UEY8_9FLAO|nr:hypothetical protein [Kriegella aquimaris]SDM58511.1 hypothetical protein SAMN04488514_1115 [Kriegella aquimaris]